MDEGSKKKKRREEGAVRNQDEERLNLQLAGQGGVIWTRIGCRE